jgi:hypothetical protein
MDVEKVASELLRSLRGNRSQVAFSRRLGYSTNVAYGWESGRRWPSAPELLRVAERAGVDVRAAFARFYRTPPDWLIGVDPAAPGFVARFLRDQQGDAAISAVAERAGANRFSVARWLAGTVDPRLPDFLRMVEATSLRMVDLVAALVDPATVPSIREIWATREAQRSVAIEEPWTQAVLRMLEVGVSEEDAIAVRLQLEPEVVGRCLLALVRAGQVRRVSGRWRPVEVAAVDTRRSPETARHLKSFWAGVGLDRLRAGAEGSFAYNVFAVSEDQLRRLTELHDAYYQALRALIAEDAPVECVALVNLQLIRLDRTAK